MRFFKMGHTLHPSLVLALATRTPKVNSKLSPAVTEGSPDLSVVAVLEAGKGSAG